jgi:hypothetical protein
MAGTHYFGEDKVAKMAGRIIGDKKLDKNGGKTRRR